MGRSATGEVPEQTPADGDDQNGTGQGQSDAHDVTDSAFHLGSGGGQGGDQLSNQGRGSTFHRFLLSYRLRAQRAKADMILFIKSVVTPMTSPSTKPDIMISVLSTIDFPQDRKPNQSAAKKEAAE